MPKVTPAMRQYHEIKKGNPDCIVLFQLGDFYEALYDDAKTVSKVLDIVLTSRNKRGERVPMAGVPVHAIDSYLTKLVNAGHKVALVAQTEAPQTGKKVVDRDVVKIATPGTLSDDTQLGSKASRYIAAIFGNKNTLSIAYADSSTGEFKTTKELTVEKLRQIITLLEPKELIIPEGFGLEFLEKLGPLPHLTRLDAYSFDQEIASEKLKAHFGASKLRGFGLEKDDYSAVSSAGALLQYLENTQKSTLKHITHLSIYSPEDGLLLDPTTVRNLELLSPLWDKDGPCVLFTIDKTHTAMGARLLREWLVRPLCNVTEIEQRLDTVETLLNHTKKLSVLPELFAEISDIERIVGRLGLGTTRPPFLVTLNRSLKAAEDLIKLMPGTKKTPRLLTRISKETRAELKKVAPLVNEIDKAILEEPASVLHVGKIFQTGYNKELDILREATASGKNWIKALEERERKRTGVASLKVRYNKVFGYYIELSKTNIDKAPKTYIRKQTLVNAERFITPELKDMEAKVLGAEERMIELEDSLFANLLQKAKQYIPPLQHIAKNLAILDILYGFSELSQAHAYIRPDINDKGTIEITRGRHPVVEQICEESGERFIANDTVIGKNKDQIVILTGPNMGGKSTYIRQVAIIVILAQIGCFVPAAKATIGIVDRVFARVGASDNLAFGESTFMVEMLEAANILNHATSRSLVILDEVGRGTSTYDGMSLAWAIVEHLHEKIGCKTLFATHYHELTALEHKLKRVKNYQVAAKDDGEKVLFLRKVLRGKADQSYGIHVAKLAGVPGRIVTRARELLVGFESGKKQATQLNLPIIQVNNRFEEKLKALDIESTTPLEALKLLAEMKAEI